VLASPPDGAVLAVIRFNVATMPKPNTVQLASVRVITDDLPRLVRFYEVLTGATPQYLTDDFVELVTPSATFALSGPDRVAFISENTPRAGANNTAIVEFLVADTEAVSATGRWCSVTAPAPTPAKVAEVTHTVGAAA
jgi:hypothetical protein